MEGLKNNFVMNVMDEHKNITNIEKRLLRETILNKNYVKFDISSKRELFEHIKIAKKYSMHYNLSSTSSKGGGRYFIFTYIYPDWQTNNNILQNFYFRNKVKHNAAQKYPVLNKFTQKYDSYMANMDDLTLNDMLDIDNYIQLKNVNINENTLEIKCEHLSSSRPYMKDYGYTSPYQKCVDMIASELYGHLLNNENGRIQFETYNFNDVDITKIINLVNIMTNNTYTLTLEQNQDYDEFWDSSDKIYVLRRTDTHISEM